MVVVSIGALGKSSTARVTFVISRCCVGAAAYLRIAFVTVMIIVFVRAYAHSYTACLAAVLGIFLAYTKSFSAKVAFVIAVFVVTFRKG